MQTLLFSLLLMTSQQDRKDLEQYRNFDHCKEEMQQAWMEYTKHAMRMRGDCTFSRLLSGQLEAEVMQNFIGDGESWKLSFSYSAPAIQKREFSSVALFRNYQNCRQAIMLVPKGNIFDKGKYWSIERMAGKNLVDGSGGTLPIDDDPKLRWKGYAIFLPLRVTHKYTITIEDVFADSAFELIDSSPSIVENQIVVKISFRIRKQTGLSRFLGDGWIELLPKQYWVAHRAELLIKNDLIDPNDPDRLWRIENHYDPASRNVPIIRTIKEYTIDDKSDTKFPHLEELGQTTFQLSDKKLSEEDLSLIPYGLKELTAEKPAEEPQVEEQQNNGRKISYLKADANFLFLPYWIWILLLLMLCLSSAILLRRRQLNAKTVKPSVR